jgi:hypothetical protein
MIVIKRVEREDEHEHDHEHEQEGKVTWVD